MGVVRATHIAFDATDIPVISRVRSHVISKPACAVVRFAQRNFTAMCINHECDNKSMPTRRQVLRSAGGVITIVLGGLQLACTREESEAIDGSGVEDTELLILVAMMRRLLPHDDLDEAVYRDAVQAFLQSGIDEAGVQSGLAVFEEAGFLDRPADEQVEMLRGIEGTDFFDAVRRAAVSGVYRDERTWNMLGYGGDASRFGGYVDRGFNDIDWLPRVETD